MLLDRHVQRVTAKELTLFFASPVAYLFLGAFAALTLFIFFWGESFFSRNIADVRPLFEWMPILLIFLSSALTMRMWSEERRSGTLEHVLTQPIGIWRFVLGKFFACLTLLNLALLITLPLPVTVSLLGNLDWGPVISGYLATFFLGGAYLSVGLFVSARSDNQIVSLISSAALCGLLYLVGSRTITGLFGNQMGEWLRLLGTGSRFDAITRGMIDVRDFYYYLSLIAMFLTLNTFSLERERWAATGNKGRHNAWRATTVLLIANVLGVNFWLGQLNVLRVDTTEGNIYSISDATHGYLAQLQEPLLIRGYFSAKTHPLLAPLVPQMRDLIREYEVAGDGRVRAEFIDPMASPELEEEANQKYGIRPVPFQVSDRYQAALVNSYFDVLVQYGDEFQTLGFQELIEVKATAETDLDVKLRNPEYDITRAVKKVLHAYQSGGNLFDTVKGALQFTAYISENDDLPEALATFKTIVEKTVGEMEQSSGGRLKTRFVVPEANGGEVAAQIERDYGFKSMMASLFDTRTFYFYLTLAQGDQVIQVPLGDLSEEEFKRNLEGGIKRFSSGFTKTVGLVTPSVDPQMARFGLGGPRFSQLSSVLESEMNIQTVDLSTGAVGGGPDLLLVAGMTELDEKSLFAIDQFLMRGGTVLLSTSPFQAEMGRNRLNLTRQKSGLEDWLSHHGLDIDEQVVLDPKNSAFPVPVTRQTAGFSFQEIRMIDYPYFPDIRTDGLNQESAITRSLNQVTMAWASPIQIDAKKNEDRNITPLLYSSEKAWLSDTLDIMPKIGPGGMSAFVPEGDTGQHLLGVVSEGRFDSYFAEKTSPLLEQSEDSKPTPAGENPGDEKAENEEVLTLGSVITRSPESARIILFSSNTFLEDRVMQLAGAVNGSVALGSVQLVANAVDWALEEQGLLSIRARGHFNRTLPPIPQEVRQVWEVMNYGLAIVALVSIALIQRFRKKRRHQRYLQTLTA